MLSADRSHRRRGSCCRWWPAPGRAGQRSQENWNGTGRTFQTDLSCLTYPITSLRAYAYAKARKHAQSLLHDGNVEGAAAQIENKKVGPDGRWHAARALEAVPSSRCFRAQTSSSGPGHTFLSSCCKRTPASLHTRLWVLWKLSPQTQERPLWAHCRSA